MRMEECRTSIVNIGNKLVSDGMATDGQGNLSCRDPESDLIAITPSAVPYQEREAEDICIIDREGDVMEGNWQPTTEFRLHLAILSTRSDVQAVIHTHAPYATIFSLVGGEPLPMVLNESAMVLGGPVPVAPYARPGTEALAQVSVEALGQGWAVIMAHHGLVTVGRSIKEAYMATVAAEHTARAVCVARSMGGNMQVLPEGEIGHLRSLYEGYSAHPRSTPDSDSQP